MDIFVLFPVSKNHCKSPFPNTRHHFLTNSALDSSFRSLDAAEQCFSDWVRHISAAARNRKTEGKEHVNGGKGTLKNNLTISFRVLERLQRCCSDRTLLLLSIIQNYRTAQQSNFKKKLDEPKKFEDHCVKRREVGDLICTILFLIVRANLQLSFCRQQIGSRHPLFLNS